MIVMVVRMVMALVVVVKLISIGVRGISREVHLPIIVITWFHSVRIVAAHALGSQG
jgi:hypothetical protein